MQIKKIIFIAVCFMTCVGACFGDESCKTNFGNLAVNKQFARQMLKTQCDKEQAKFTTKDLNSVYRWKMVCTKDKTLVCKPYSCEDKYKLNAKGECEYDGKTPGGMYADSMFKVENKISVSDNTRVVQIEHCSDPEKSVPSHKTPTQDGKTLQQEALKSYNLTKVPANFAYPCECDQNLKKTAKCIKFFEKTNVHTHSIAIMLAQEYGAHILKQDLICGQSYFLLNSQHSIACVSKDGKNQYEFIFNSVNETSDAKFRKSTGLAACRIYLGDKSTAQKLRYRDEKYSYKDAMKCIVPNVQNLKNQDYAKDKERNQDICRLLEKNFLIPKLGWSLFRSDFSVDNGYTEAIDAEGCGINFGGVSGMSGEVQACEKLVKSSLQEVDPERFKKLQGTANDELIAYLGLYVQGQQGQTVNSFSCDRMPVSCTNDDNMNPRDDILRCDADGATINFLFDDLAEGRQGAKDATVAAMKCMKNGVFDGKNCQGPNQEECELLGKEVPGGTKWQDNTCLLNAAADEASIQEWVDRGKFIGNIGITVGAIA